MQKLVRQTLFLSCCHFIVRVIGFVMRIWLSRELGTLTMGLVELAQSAQMLLISPVISGLPAAVSRMCAREDEAGCRRVLHLGMALSLTVSLPLMMLSFVFREPIALWLGDIRTLPALLVYLPCLPVLGLSCSLNGYYYGIGKPVPPALSELLEQLVRFLLSMRLITYFKDWPVMLRAAIPAVSALIGETAGLLLMLLLAIRMLLQKAAPKSKRKTTGLLSEMLSLALPLTGMRLLGALIRTVSSALLPKRLMQSGLPTSEALSQLGIMQGMLMPILMLPSFITCSLSTVAAPELARRQAQERPLSGMIRRSMQATLLIGSAAMCAIWFFAPLFSETLYRQAELLPMIRRSCALVPVMAMTHVAGGMMNGLGLQNQSLRIALVSNLVSLLLMYTLAAIPSFRIWGAIIANASAQAITLALSLHTLRSEIRKGYTSQ